MTTEAGLDGVTYKKRGEVPEEEFAQLNIKSSHL